MIKRSGLYPSVQADAAGAGVVSHAGGIALLETVRAAGLDTWLDAWPGEALGPWRRPTAVHDPAKVVLDLAVALALGGDCRADVAVLRAEPAVYGLVACDPTVSRTIDALAADAHERWRRSTRLGRPPGPACGSSPASTPPTTGRARRRRWSSMSTRRW